MELMGLGTWLAPLGKGPPWHVTGPHPQLAFRCQPLWELFHWMDETAVL